MPPQQEYESDDAAQHTAPKSVGTVASSSSTTRTVLVTGGAGFIGSHTANALLAMGDSVVIVDEMNEYYDSSLKRANITELQSRYGADRCRFVEADICDVAVMSSVYEAAGITHVVHLAARAGVRPSIRDPMLYLHSNVEGTTKMLELAAKNNIVNFVYASSSSVYGGSKKTLFSETDIVDSPVSQYAATKKMCELLAHTYHHLYKLNVTGLRFFTVYGPSGRPDMAAFKFIDAIANGRTIDRYGDGSSERDWTYVGDIVDGILRALDRPMGCEVFNLGNGNPVKLSDFISEVEAQLGVRASIRELPEQPGDVPRTAADVSKARRLLGYNPQISLKEGLRRTIAWYRSCQ